MKSHTLTGNALVAKVGTNSIISDGVFHTQTMMSVLTACQRLLRQGDAVVLISSGAVGAGYIEKPNVSKLLAAAQGQPILMETYRAVAKQIGLHVGQALLQQGSVTQTLSELIIEAAREEVLLILNENDVMHIQELQALGCGADNDANVPVAVRLCQRQQLRVRHALFLTSTRGILDDQGRTVSHQGVYSQEVRDHVYQPHIASTTSDGGTGGMMSKLHHAHQCWELGVDTTHIACAGDGFLCLEESGISTVFNR